MSDDRWLSDYLLGEGSDQERADAQRRLDNDPQLRDRAQQLAGVVEHLQTLPPPAWKTISNPDTDTPDRGTLAHARARPRLPRPVLAVALAAVMFAIGIAVGALLTGGGGSSPATTRTVLLRPLDGAPARATAAARLSSDGRLVLTVDHLPQPAAGHYYEAWLMSSTRRLIPLASFRVAGGRARLILELPAPATRYRYIDISLQRADAGSAHSKRSVLRGATAG